MYLYNSHSNYYYYLLIYIFIFAYLIEVVIHLKIMSDWKDVLPDNYIDFHISHHLEYQFRQGLKGN